MSTKLRDIQQSFMTDIYAGTKMSAPLLATPDMAERLSIYHNNMLGGLFDCLENAYPIVQQVVGHGFFKTLAAHFAMLNPQAKGDRNTYGAGLADFIRSYQPAHNLPYLPDLAALEWAHFKSFFAPDALALTLANISTALESPVNLHPSATLVQAQYNVFDIWQAHQKPDVHVTVTKTPQTVLCWRDADDTSCLRVLTPAETHLCLSGKNLGQALIEASAQINDLAQFQQDFAALVTAGVFRKTLT